MILEVSYRRGATFSDASLCLLLSTWQPHWAACHNQQHRCTHLPKSNPSELISGRHFHFPFFWFTPSARPAKVKSKSDVPDSKTCFSQTFQGATLSSPRLLLRTHTPLLVWVHLHSSKNRSLFFSALSLLIWICITQCEACSLHLWIASWAVSSSWQGEIGHQYNYLQGCFLCARHSGFCD